MVYWTKQHTHTHIAYIVYPPNGAYISMNEKRAAIPLQAARIA